MNLPPPIPAAGTAPEAPIPNRPAGARRWRRILAFGLLGGVATFFLVLPVVAVIGVTSYLRLSSDTKALRDGILEAAKGDWDKRFAGRAGGFTMGLVRGVTAFVHLEAEPRAALAALRGVEVGVYQRSSGHSSENYGAVLAAADRVMRSRGWERVVGVTEKEQLVAIYLPRRGATLESVRCCVVVLQEGQLVVVSARGNLAPLLQFVPSDPLRQARGAGLIFKSRGVRSRPDKALDEKAHEDFTRTIPGYPLAPAPHVAVDHRAAGRGPSPRQLAAPAPGRGPGGWQRLPRPDGGRAPV